MNCEGSLYDRAALRGIETALAREADDPGEWMRRAGMAAWQEASSQWPDAQSILVVCGPGNNGGDGYQAAKQARLAGRQVRVFRSAQHVPQTPLARHAALEYRQSGGDIAIFETALPASDLIIDALFGVGLTRALDSDSISLIDAMNSSTAPILSLDAPSGVDTDGGAVGSKAVYASTTLQFVVRHRGLATGPALDHVGRLAHADLDVPVEIFGTEAPSAHLLARNELAGTLPQRGRNAHKGQAGHVLCIGGDHGHGGAILLAAEAALRVGAGLVSVATRTAHVPAILARRPELMAYGVEDPSALATLFEHADVVAIGPGLRQLPWGAELYRRALCAGKPLVLDADALNLLAQHPNRLSANTILTPHPGEAARLLGIETSAVQNDRYRAAEILVERFGCIVVLKGAGTIVAAPNATPYVIRAGNPGMAVGGMGDVLTGVIASLRAQMMPTYEAAAYGALLHALAGDDVATLHGEIGLLPSDLFVSMQRLRNG